jgi:hypothetical protein
MPVRSPRKNVIIFGSWLIYDSFPSREDARRLCSVLQRRTKPRDPHLRNP